MNIAISGSTCVGKTTLIRLLLKDKMFQDKGVLISESAEQNPHLGNPKETFQSQMFFYTTYLDDILHLSNNKDFEYVFYDRTIDEHLLISKFRYEIGEMTASEYFICKKFAGCIKELQPQIHKTIFLYCSAETAYFRQRKRGDKSPYNIMFYNELNRVYQEWAKAQQNILFVDTDNSIDVNAIVDFISN
ncbi:MAG: deoxynucleoside kinase [Clostridia bacterium]|nr:deoxynucleoside kinase [Clostridia bacterium]